MERVESRNLVGRSLRREKVVSEPSRAPAPINAKYFPLSSISPSQDITEPESLSISPSLRETGGKWDVWNVNVGDAWTCD